MSQSVEQDHPSAFDFLRSDIRNVEDFFTRRSGGEVKTLGIRRAWSFIVDENVGLKPEEEAGDGGEDRLLDILRTWLDREPEAEPISEVPGEAGDQTSVDAKAKKEVDDAVFFSSYIPRSLGEVYDPERDIDILKAGKGDTLIYAGITKLDINEGKEAEAEPGVAAQAEEAVAPKGKKSKSKSKANVATEGVNAAEPTPAPAPAAEEEADAQPDEPQARRPSKSVHWADEADAEADEDAEVNEADFVRRPRGLRHEDRDAKKVSMP